MLPVELYEEQQKLWPSEGKHILAHFDEDTVVVYQAYKREIATYAIENNRLGGPEFSTARMSWIKPNFLWMMFRSGWGTKPNQEVVLGLRIRRAFFDEILENASSTKAERQKEDGPCQVRLQWDPDHDPQGNCLQRRAVQLGLRDTVLQRLVKEETVEVIDMSELVEGQRDAALLGQPTLVTPRERVYNPPVHIANIIYNM